MRALLAFLLVCCGSYELFAQKTLHWSRLDVEASLDRDGRLHVAEQQAIVFNGDWNGGERRFNIRLGQELTLKGISRVVAGVAQPLREGDLSAVDHYAWHDSNTLRWRSRLPSDPPFANTEIVYRIDYMLENILRRDDDRYVLDHDFAFPDRSGVIEEFSLRLQPDDAWEPLERVGALITARNLQPGQSFVLRIPLRYRGAGRPASVYFGASTGAGLGIAAAFLFGVGILVVGFIRDERRIGRFTPLLSPDRIDRAWLDENVFRHPPEVVGAAWDDQTSASEVAAVLARMTAEGKLASRVYEKGFWPLIQRELQLTLLIPMEQLSGYEKTLVNALFVAGDTTSTELIRQHYKKRGFHPASKIEKPVKRLASQLGAKSKGRGSPKRRWQPTLVLALGAVALLAASFTTPTQNIIAAAAGTGILTALYIFGIIAASSFQSRVVSLAAHGLVLAIALAILTAAIMLFVLIVPAMAAIGYFPILGLPLLALAATRSVLNMARSRDSGERLELRRRLAAARNFFRMQLRRPNPQLEDGWFPYLLAFGLGGDVDRWFRAFGTVATSRSFSTSSVSSSSRSGSGWTGGGGAFGGAGGSGSWALAAGSLAAGVSTPSSGGSGGGGGGGGGSSGGGGGGGW